MLIPASENVAILLWVTKAALIINAATAPPLASQASYLNQTIGFFLRHERMC